MSTRVKRAVTIAGALGLLGAGATATDASADAAAANCSATFPAFVSGTPTRTTDYNTYVNCVGYDYADQTHLLGTTGAAANYTTLTPHHYSSMIYYAGWK